MWVNRVRIPRLAPFQAPFQVPPLTPPLTPSPTPSAAAIPAEEALAARLAQECAQLAALYRVPAEYGCDPNGGWWVHLAELPLPEGMNRTTTPIILLLPGEYPATAPTAFYVPADLAGSAGWQMSELLPAAEGSPAPEPWSRCAFPHLRWREGDDLDRVLCLLQAILQAAARVRLTLGGEQPGGD